MSSSSQPPVVIPEGYKLHTENTSHILLPNTKEAFLNPVQEFNRDLSVAAIRTWSEELNEAKEKKWKQAQERKAKRSEDVGEDVSRKRPKLEGSTEPAIGDGQADEPSGSGGGSTDIVTGDAKASAEYRSHKFVLLEALSATGLRSIRYAKEIPLIKHVIANDISSSATAAMKRNVELNGLADGVADARTEDINPAARKSKLGKVRINEGDARALMYHHSQERNRVDVVDLDPYGTAAPFIDAAVQCINDGGLLCVTCTDLSVLATNNYPEKCYSNYGGVPVKAEYCHEVALRLVLNTISSSAARYGRYIQPLLSLSIDFYVRLFVKVQTGPFEVKKTASKTSIYYVCSGCQSFYGQSLGRVVEKVNDRNGNVNPLFKTHPGPPVSEKCPECASPLHANAVAGPMWAGPIHDPRFVGKVLEHLEDNQDKYGTATRMKGMLTVAQEELDTPFYFTPSRIAGFFHSTCPSLDDVASALLNAGHNISRSHAAAGSLKTTATRADLHDVFRSWVQSHPVKMEKIAENAPARVLLAKEPRAKADFTRHPQTVTPSSKVKLVRYQQNPTPNWGPGTKAESGTKRKRQSEVES
ncbi:N2,N2-dimethylguanosine tRNA methyltransferase [Auriscalpium vulgare]|uniref:N2,N2-dimethylguanosine tRNA methyltransferase n=1 Tax=Auriscalpium vulgare TaxID=40419 RepID=A0ACB8SDR6_9AGAM|nr:N2,N2-dimethylguanosine tRNA methyltransferase [Auriscalpium vulgare]